MFQKPLYFYIVPNLSIYQTVKNKEMMETDKKKLAFNEIVN